MILYVTYCSAKKNKGNLPPDKLYISNRITRFINHCKTAKVNWAILSVLHGFVFPNQVKNDYDVTFKTYEKYWLGIAVCKNRRKLPKEESKEHLEKLSKKLLKHAKEKQINKIVFYAPTPRRAKTYLQILHYTFDNCSTPHKTEELITHSI